ncbi:MAG: hypothetical protein AB7E70_02955 [Hyphomicrobiaceae bacterium]
MTNRRNLILLLGAAMLTLAPFAAAQARGAPPPDSWNRSVDRQLKKLEREEKRQREAEERRKDPYGRRCGCGPSHPCSC